MWDGKRRKLLTIRSLSLSERTFKDLVARSSRAGPTTYRPFWPPAQSLFHFGALHFSDLALCLTVGAVSLVLLEILKSRSFRSEHVAPSTLQ